MIFRYSLPDIHDLIIPFNQRLKPGTFSVLSETKYITQNCANCMKTWRFRACLRTAIFYFCCIFFFYSCKQCVSSTAKAGADITVRYAWTVEFLFTIIKGILRSNHLSSDFPNTNVGSSLFQYRCGLFLALHSINEIPETPVLLGTLFR